MEIRPTAIPGVVILVPTKHVDERGFLSEVHNRDRLLELGLSGDYVQENHVLSTRIGTVRGLHYQIPPAATAKLVRVIRGSIFDVAVDLRTGSASYGRHVFVTLSAENFQQLYLPIGFAHGFCTLEANTEVVYKTTAFWSPDVDRGLLWNDSDLGIPWPVDPSVATVSAKDRAQPAFHDLEPALFSG